VVLCFGDGLLEGGVGHSGSDFVFKFFELNHETVVGIDLSNGRATMFLLSLMSWKAWS
jgi:hypothetical protein